MDRLIDGWWMDEWMNLGKRGEDGKEIELKRWWVGRKYNGRRREENGKEAINEGGCE